MFDLESQEMMNLYQIARNVVLRNELDAYETESLKGLLAALDQAKNEVSARFEHSVADMKDWTADRLERVLYELDEMSAGVRQHLSGQLLDMAGHVGEYATLTHGDILSLGGRVAAFESVALTSAQYRAFFAETELGGHSLQGWVDRAFDGSMQRAMLTDLQSGVLQGEGYPALVRRIEEGFDMFRGEAITLARTYVQTANVTASQIVADANNSIMRGWRWCSTLEHGFHQSGTGTCLRCAALDGKEFKIGQGPVVPLHPRCRCFIIWLTKTWRELGLDIDEMKEAARPYTIRPDKNIDAGGRRTILESGFHQGTYGEWIMAQNENVKLNLLGPGRYDLLKSGKVNFGDLVDAQGNLKTLKILGGA